jgi:hypothetical protein
MAQKHNGGCLECKSLARAVVYHEGQIVDEDAKEAKWP